MGGSRLLGGGGVWKEISPERIRGNSLSQNRIEGTDFRDSAGRPSRLATMQPWGAEHRLEVRCADRELMKGYVQKKETVPREGAGPKTAGIKMDDYNLPRAETSRRSRSEELEGEKRRCQKV